MYPHRYFYLVALLTGFTPLVIATSYDYSFLCV